MANKIDHKFDIDDKAFFISNNKVNFGKVYGISINIQRAATYPHGLKPITRIEYKIQCDSLNQKDLKMNENELFATKQELLDSL